MTAAGRCWKSIKFTMKAITSDMIDSAVDVVDGAGGVDRGDIIRDTIIPEQMTLQEKKPSVKEDETVTSDTDGLALLLSATAEDDSVVC